MNTNNPSGRNIAIIIGVWFIVKEVLNIFIGGGINFVYLLFAVAAVVLCFLGIKYTNYAVAAIAAVIVLVNIGGNIKGLFDITSMFRSMIYLVEGLVDIACAAALCIAPSVKEHFSNDISNITGGN